MLSVDVHVIVNCELFFSELLITRATKGYSVFGVNYFNTSIAIVIFLVNQSTT